MLLQVKTTDFASILILPFAFLDKKKYYMLIKWGNSYTMLEESFIKKKKCFVFFLNS